MGVWRGQQSTRVVIYPEEVEIILDGAPGARTGIYHYSTTISGTWAEVDERHFEWSNQWEMRPIVIGGVPMRVVHLDRLAGAHTPDYILTPDDLLIPLPEPAHPNVSAAGRRVALYPVPRGSYGYGRP